MEIMAFRVAIVSAWLIGCGHVNPNVDLCTDGKLDGDETEVDCGGSCAPCVGVCGNGIVEGTEQCDDGHETATCDSDCTFAMCGDGVVNMTAGEECDDTTPTCSSCKFVTAYPSTGADGPFAPVANIVLAPGIYNYTTITVPAGVKVTTNGTGVLDLRASGDVTILGSIDVSGSIGGNGVGLGPTCYEGGGGGGATGNVLAAAPGGGCPIASGGGMGSAGANSTVFSSGCSAYQGGSFGGGAGGGVCGGGAGGGGIAGGGGGGGWMVSAGGAGGGVGGGSGSPSTRGHRWNGLRREASAVLNRVDQ